MQFGICAPLEDAAKAKAAGADFIEANVQLLLRGLESDEQWKGLQDVRRSPLPVQACNCLVPGELKITGPDVDLGKLRDYIARVCQRAGQCGVEILVFGSGAARNVPDGFAQARAKDQLVDFLGVSGRLAGENGVTIVIEPLSRSECNCINLVGEAMELAKRVDTPSVQCLVDSYHFWVNADSLGSLKEAVRYIYHVHVADSEGRVAPGLSGSADYLPLFRVLKDAGYDRRISIEAVNLDIAKDGYKTMEYLRQQWQNA